MTEIDVATSTTPSATGFSEFVVHDVATHVSFDDCLAFNANEDRQVSIQSFSTRYDEDEQDGAETPLPNTFKVKSSPEMTLKPQIAVHNRYSSAMELTTGRKCRKRRSVLSVTPITECESELIELNSPSTHSLPITFQRSECRSIMVATDPEITQYNRNEAEMATSTHSSITGFNRVPFSNMDLIMEDEGNIPQIGHLWGIHQKLSTLRGRMVQQKISEESVIEEQPMEDYTTFPPSYIVIRFTNAIQPRTVTWLTEKLRGKRYDGGAELCVFAQPFHPDEGVVLHVSASKIKFLEVAEEMEIVKEDRQGNSREFTLSDLDAFLPEGMNVEDLFSVGERQTMVKHEIENIRALVEDEFVPGYPNALLYEGQSIMQVCTQWHLVKQIYPLHDHEALKKLGKKWYLGLFRKQPFEEIRLYFGEAIALYFTFLGFYTTALLVPMLLGFIQLLLWKEAVPFFCIFNVVWVTVFLEVKSKYPRMAKPYTQLLIIIKKIAEAKQRPLGLYRLKGIWRRRSNELAFKWGTIGMTSLDEPRMNFRGQVGVDAVTGKSQPQYPRWMTYSFMYCVSFPIVILCMTGAFLVMLLSFWIEEYIRNMDSTWSQQLIQLPSVVYTALVYVMNLYYRKLATYLTEWENHRTQSQFDRHRVTKLVLFEFVNNFMSLFYIAFVIQDLDMLKTQLATMLIILQAINNFQEAILPLVLKFYVTKMDKLKKYIKFLRPFSESSENINQAKKALSTFISPLGEIPVLPTGDPRIEAANKEATMENYEETYDDYLEMFIQFGYVVLFSSVYPVAAFWAVINNILEIRADAFKLCLVYQRPMGKRVKDIGAWQKAFSIIGALSIMTNCGLLCLSSQLRKPSDTADSGWFLKFVLLEHFMLALRYLLHISIPDKPEWVRVALAKKNHESRQALKNERMEKNRRALTRRFKSVPPQTGRSISMLS